MNRSVLVRANFPEAVHVLQQLLCRLPPAQEVPEFAFAVEPGDQGASLRLPSGGTRACPSIEDAFYALETFVYDDLLPASRDCFVLHAAGLVHRESGRCLIIAGPSRCGKSSLCLGLTAGNRFRYLAEEAVGLTMNGRVIPYPKPFRIRHGLEHILGDRTDWIRLGRTEAGARYIIPPEAAVETEPGPFSARFVLFPEFTREAEGVFEPLDRGELLGRLATCTTNEGEFLGRHLGELARATVGLTGWRFRWNDLRTAASRIEDLIDSESRQRSGFD